MIKVGASDVSKIMIGTQEVKKVYQGSTVVWERVQPFLEVFPNSYAAYSLQSMDGNPSAPVVEVRSGSTSQLFTELEVVDGTLEAFCNGDDGFVKSLQDQSESGFHLGQPDDLSQPILVRQGVLHTINGSPAISFDGATQSLFNDTFTLVGANDFTYVLLGQNDPSRNNGLGGALDFGYNRDATSTGSLVGFNRYRVDPFLSFSSEGFGGRFDSSTDYLSGARGGDPTYAQYIVGGVVDSTSSTNKAYSFGQEVGSMDLVYPLDNGPHISVGEYRSAAGYYQFNLQELIIYKDSISESMQPMADAINDRYKISGPGSLWTPLNYPNLVAWYDPNDLDTLELSTDKVDEFRDKSGNLHHLLKVTDAERPRMVNKGGLNFIVFEGAQVIQSAKVNWTGLDVNVACVISAADGDQRILDTRGQGGTTTEDMPGWQLKAWSGIASLLLSGDLANQNVRVGFNTPFVDVATVISVEQSADNYLNGRSYLNGVDDSTETLTTDAVSNLDSPFGLTMGGASNNSMGQYLTGELGDVVVADGIPTESDRQKLEGYLAHKWGTTGALPVDHPYKTEVPLND